MNETDFNQSSKTSRFALRYSLAAIGFTFLIFGLGLTIGIVYLAYSFFTQPEQLSTILSYINVQDDVFVKWMINGQTDEIIFSRIIMIIFGAMAIAIILQAVISFISMCITSGKGIVSISRNFDS